jgi:hypothetical protein
MVRRVDNNLVLELRVATRNQAEHIRRLDACDFDIHADRRRNAKWHGLKVPVIGRFP